MILSDIRFKKKYEIIVFLHRHCRTVFLKYLHTFYTNYIVSFQRIKIKMMVLMINKAWITPAKRVKKVNFEENVKYGRIRIISKKT